VVSWPGGEGAVAHCKFLAVGKLLENLFVRKFLPNSIKFWIKTFILGKLKGIIEIFSAHNLFGKKFDVVCWNSVGNLQCLLQKCNFLLCLLF